MTQNASGIQFDVYFRFSDANPFVTSIQCPIGATTGCFSTADLAADGDVDTVFGYSLLPGVLHAYRVSATDLGDYIVPSERLVADHDADDEDEE